jgi:hypothetical protein
MGTIQQVVVESLRAQLSTLQIESIPVVGIWCAPFGWRPLGSGYEVRAISSAAARRGSLNRVPREGVIRVEVGRSVADLENPGLSARG